MSLEIASLKTQFLKLFQVPLQTVSFYLILLALAAVFLKFDAELAVTQSIRFVVLLIAFGIPSFVQHRQAALKYPFIANRLVTILILFLIIDETASLPMLFAIGLVAALVKHFVRLNNLPVLNPAATGIVIAAMNGVFDSWWGVSFSPRFTDYWLSSALLLTIPFGVFVAHKYKKLPISGSFFLVFAVLSTLMQGKVPVSMLFEGTVIFFALIMATEPKTTPTVLLQQVMFGIGVAVLSALFINFYIIAPYALALVICNALYRGFQWWQLKQKRAQLAARQATPVAPVKVTAAPAVPPTQPTTP